MNSSLYVFGILLLGFVAYYFLRDYLFDSSDSSTSESFRFSDGTPAPASVTIRQAPLYPERTVSPMGPSPPSAQAPDEVIVHGPPQANDPYREEQESSDIPETLRHPERSYRPAPAAQHTEMAVESGIASHRVAPAYDGSSSRSTEPIQNSGEFMSGVFANDSFEDNAFSSF